MLEEGHETTATTPVDGRLDEILEMPGESPWPVALAIVTTIGCALIIANHLLIAAAMAAIAAAMLAAWHGREPEAA